MVTKTQQTDVNNDLIIFTQHKEDIRKAAEQAKTTIADAAGLAAKAIAEAAAVSVKVLSIKNADDHDLLIELKVGNQFIRDDIKSLSNGVSAQLDQLQKNKADKVEFDNLCTEIHVTREKRMRDLENKTNNYMITMSLLMIAIGTLVTVLLIHIFK